MLCYRAALGCSRAARTLPRASPPPHRARRGGLIAGRAAPPAPPEAARTPPRLASLAAPAAGSRGPPASRRPTPRLSKPRLEHVSSRRLVPGTLSASPGFEPCGVRHTRLRCHRRCGRGGSVVPTDGDHRELLGAVGECHLRTRSAPPLGACARCMCTCTCMCMCSAQRSAQRSAHIVGRGARRSGDGSSPLSAACSGAGAQRARGWRRPRPR